MIRRLTIQAKLLGIFVMAAVLPIAVVSLLAYNNSLKAVEKMVGNRTNRVAASVGEDLSRKLSRRLGDTVLWTNEPVQRYLQLVGTADFQARLRAINDLNAYFSDVVFEEYGRYYREMILVDASGEPIFRFGRSKGSEGTPHVTLPAGSGGDSLAVSLPEELPLPKQLAWGVEAWSRTLEARIRSRADDLEGVLGARPPAPPALPGRESALDQDVVKALVKAFRQPLPGALENLEFAGPEEPRSPAERRWQISVATFSQEDRMAARTGIRLEADSSRVFVHRSTTGRPEAIRIVRPVFSTGASPRRLGAMILDLRPDYLFPEDLAAERFGSKGELAVVDTHSEEILFHSRPLLEGKDVSRVNPVLAAAVHEGSRHPGQAPASWSRIEGPEGRSLASVMELQSVPWTVIATAVPREFESEARQAGLLNLLVASLAVLIALLVLITASRKISGSIHAVTEGAREITAGNLNHSIHVGTHDEIQTLADTFNTMTASLRESISLREKAARELEALNRTLEDRVHDRTQELVKLNEALNQANQELKELDRLKSNFLSTVSHEFRTPLTSITAFSEILIDELAEKEAPEEVKRFLGIINTESARLGRLIKNLLDLSRIEAGRMRWDRSRFPIREVLDAACDGLLPVFSEKGVRVVRRIECPDDAQVNADRDRIQQVITNLLENAVKFSHKEQRIWVMCHPSTGGENGHPWLHITVKDEGLGIPREHLVRIFERFSQVDDADTRGTGGSGLGLAISREIVEHHGGRIWAESEKGRGAAFHFTLPCASGEDTGGADAGTGGARAAGRPEPGITEGR